MLIMKKLKLETNFYLNLNSKEFFFNIEKRIDNNFINNKIILNNKIKLAAFWENFVKINQFSYRTPYSYRVYRISPL